MGLSNSAVRHVLSSFRIYGRLLSVGPYGSGHINDTFASVYDQAGTTIRYIHQRINSTVFRRPDRLMENIERVTVHQQAKRDESANSSRAHLTLVPSHDGQVFHVDDDGNYWRTYLFIEGAKTYDVVETEAQAESAAAAFARFQRDLSDLPGDPPHETIPDFHNSPKRFASLTDALASDPCNRAAEARPEIEFVLNREADLRLLIDLQADRTLPTRVTHNDTKLNNVMLDMESGEGVCVIDLDTVMPGIVHYDFGDLVRSSTSPVAEDEPDVGKVTMRLPMFEALVRGYLGEARPFLTSAEIEHLAFAGRLMTLTIGLRFLTDFLQGDVYFKTARPRHNLDRCRTQFALVRSMEDQQEAMEQVVRRESER